LEELHRGKVPLDETFQFKVWWLPVKEDHLDIDIFAILM